MLNEKQTNTILLMQFLYSHNILISGRVLVGRLNFTLTIYHNINSIVLVGRMTLTKKILLTHVIFYNDKLA